MADVYQPETDTFNWRRVSALSGAFTVHVFALALLATPASPPEAPEKKVDNKVTVQANTEWQAAGLALRPGDTLRIRQISGAWSECALTGCAFHDAAGDPGAPRAQASNAVQGCPHASLVARAD